MKNDHKKFLTFLFPPSVAFSPLEKKGISKESNTELSSSVFSQVSKFVLGNFQKKIHKSMKKFL